MSDIVQELRDWAKFSDVADRPFTTDSLNEAADGIESLRERVAELEHPSRLTGADADRYAQRLLEIAASLEYEGDDDGLPAAVAEVKTIADAAVRVEETHTLLIACLPLGTSEREEWRQEWKRAIDIRDNLCRQRIEAGKEGGDETS